MSFVQIWALRFSFLLFAGAMIGAAAPAAADRSRPVDVMLVIDGTLSMAPHIDALAGQGTDSGVAAALKAALADDPDLADLKIRLGFRVYRDLYDGVGGIGEGYLLGADCAHGLDARAFRQALRQVDTRAGNSAHDLDFEENVFGGIVQGAGDMATCADHAKVMIVIGDSGYDIESQIEQGGIGLTEGQVVDFLTLNQSPTARPVVPFFVHVPGATQNPDALRAQDLFVRQAMAIVAPVLRHLDSQGGGTKVSDAAERHVYQSTRGGPELVEIVVAIITAFGASAAAD